jgi:hypothetical protein
MYEPAAAAGTPVAAGSMNPADLMRRASEAQQRGDFDEAVRLAEQLALFEAADQPARRQAGAGGPAVDVGARAALQAERERIVARQTQISHLLQYEHYAHEYGRNTRRLAELDDEIARTYMYGSNN